MPKHLRSLRDLDASQLRRVLKVATGIKDNPSTVRTNLDGKSVAMIFSKPSTRTRVSFEVGIFQMGGQALFLSAAGATGLQINRGETPHDTAQVLSRYVDAIVIRTFEQAQVEALAKHGTVPVINALTDAFHPCQALADVFTMRERFGEVKGKKLVFVGPGNNVTHSLMLAGPLAGFDVTVACPEGLPPAANITKEAMANAEKAGTKITLEHDAAKAVEGAHVIYTDTWVSMGQEDEEEELKKKLAGYAVTAELMGRAADDAIFMHCLPAHRGEEVTDEVMDGPQSVVFDQAENRLHTQKALLLLLMGAFSWS